MPHRAAVIEQPASPYLMTLRKELKGGLHSIGVMPLGDLTADICCGGDSLWAIVRRPRRGGLAIRLAYAPGMELKYGSLKRSKRGFSLTAETALGTYAIAARLDGTDLHRLRLTITLVPSAELLLPFVPRDLYPLDENDDPLGASGTIEAGQRGLNSGLLYFSIDKPAFGSVLYFQNLTALNDYFTLTGTKPDGVVGGEWPEIGYFLPTSIQSGTPPINPLPAGRKVTLSDAIIVFRDAPAQNECESARLFVQMLGAVYTALELPERDFRDWVDRAEQTLRDLSQSPKATIRHYGKRYAHPYTASEYPDSMVQLSLLASMRDYAAWRGRPGELEKEFSDRLKKFFDSELQTIRRYLPNVGSDKDADAVDSWYLYHPLLNLARLAIAGDEKARDLFLRSVDYGIKAAHHFQYKWPIQYKVTDFSVITAVAGADGRGQTDVGGLYAWVMLQAYELTRKERFLREAEAAIDAACGMRFNLNYQANLTAWGAAACLRLWRVTNVRRYLEQSYVYLASFFHNCAIWESEIGGAAQYRNFFGVTCLQDAPYMAIYECFDSFSAFECYLRDSGPELEPAARMLISEYCKYALDRAWFYYPDALPPELLATEVRNGHIDRALSFPLEDLYVDGQPAGQVGQEIYGAGAAFVFASRTFHQVSEAPFRLFCDHFIMASERTGERAISVTLDGGETCHAALSIVRCGKEGLPACRLVSASGSTVRGRKQGRQRIDFSVPASGRYILSWDY
ncbi:hypothetical protein ACM61V_17350 [Sphingomonas sp. TX0543]|uniref:hypothetical protein n=1 Tax=Sphingomonas sp. TX0543 TaxID=3399682 RepID=UPI003AFA9B51